MDEEAIHFLEQHDTGVLSTIDPEGRPTAAPMYYTVQGGHVFVMTKNTTRKARNVLSHPAVAFTVYDPTTLQVVQIQAQAEAVTDHAIQESVYNTIVRPHPEAEGNKPPVTLVHSGSYIVFRIAPESLSYSDFRQWQA